MTRNAYDTVRQLIGPLSELAACRGMVLENKTEPTFMVSLTTVMPCPSGTFIDVQLLYRKPTESSASFLSQFWGA